ncbi:TrkH family potassium uptake protein [Planctomycetota bacterium]
MNKRVLFYNLGSILLFNALFLVIPLLVGLACRDEDSPYYAQQTQAFLITIIISLGLGLFLRKIFDSVGSMALGIREGFGVVALGWVVIALIGALPFYLSGIFPCFTDAFFESMSGFTTTGSSVLKDIESLPHGILFWRSFTQWLGGMGIIVLALAVLPALGVGGYQLFRLESSGSGAVGKLRPRFAETARILWGVYLVFTLLEILFLKLAGMSLFDGVCHAFTTVSTGGFSTRNQNLAAFSSPYIHYIVLVFMFLSAWSFRLHYFIIKGKIKEVFKDPQLKPFILMCLIGIIFVGINLITSSAQGPLNEKTVRDTCFQVVSVSTSTGFTTADFNSWPDFTRICLLILMLIGGCAGSTAGALKQVRFVVLIKVVICELRRFVRPNQVIPVKLGSVVIGRDAVRNILGFFLLYIGIFGVATLIMSALGLDFVSAIGAVIANITNEGPGLGSVAADYALVPILGKWVLIFCMLAGRLEIFSVFLLLLPLTWKK